MTVAAPVAVTVKLTGQLAVPVASAVRVQLVVPSETELLDMKLMLPVGVVIVLALEVSVTAAVQLDASFTTTGLMQVTLVVVSCLETAGLTVMDCTGLVLPECTDSPAKMAVTVEEPGCADAKLASQLAVPILEPAIRVHGEPLKEPATSVETKLTLPVGVIASPAETSITVPTQLEAWFTVTVLSHVTNVSVDRGFTMMVAAALVLALWVESPP